MKGIEALQNRMDQSFEKLSDYLQLLIQFNEMHLAGSECIGALFQEGQV